MAKESPIIEIDQWLVTPPGRYLIDWEQAQLDRLVGNVFGYHAAQLGWPAVQALRCNRIAHRWLLSDGGLPTDLMCDYEALPFPSSSLDLVVLPHTLELAGDAHHTLREVERVLVPEGRLIVLGFNPASLWGAYKAGADVAGRLGWGAGPVTGATELIGWRRLRDWLRLLGLEFESGRFGCYRPPFAAQRWLDRCSGFDRAGARWWPVLGSAYVLVAVKRVRAMRMVGPAWHRKARPAGAPVVVTQRHRDPGTDTRPR
jgi:SAM-dependent methyltransferase